MSHQPQWSAFQAINPLIQKRLLENGFSTPTDVQSEVIKSYKYYKDFIIASQTGSGKTLAFGIPIISDLIYQKTEVKSKLIQCLVLTPTRELAMQIMKHLKPIAGQEISIGCLIGGMSKQKQQRILNEFPQILVATPGRLWEFIEANQTRCLKTLNQLKYLVIDEADRMVELGHFDDLDKIIEKLSQPAEITYDKQLISRMMKKKSDGFKLKNKNSAYEMEPDQVVELDYNDFLQMQKGEEVKLPQQQESDVDENEEEEEDIEDEEDEGEEGQEEEADEQDEQQEWGQEAYEQYQEGEKHVDGNLQTQQKVVSQLKTFLVSATLTQQFSKGSKFKFYKEKNANKEDKEVQTMVPKLQSLIGKLKISVRPKVIDLTQNLLFPEKLQFLQCHVEENDKMLYLVNFIRRHEDETFIIFLNSIFYGRKVASLLEVLNIKSVCLHSLQQQRQRLKKLDQFSLRKIKILVCTDVAARGLDIPDVNNVIHYQIPYNADTFVHRCGRTARIGKEGTTLCLIGPKDIVRFQKIEKDVIKGGKDFQHFSVTFKEQEDLQQIISSAQHVEKEKHAIDKKSRIKDKIKIKLMNADLDEDDEDLRNELLELEEDIITKKRIFNKENSKYQAIIAQKQQPDQRQFNRNRRNALFLNPQQIMKLQDQMAVANSRMLDDSTHQHNKINKIRQKRNRKSQY